MTNIPSVVVLCTTTQSPAPTGARQKLNANLEQGRICSTLHDFMLSKVQMISAALLTQYTYDGTRWMLASTLPEAEWCDGNIMLSLQRGGDN